MKTAEELYKLVNKESEEWLEDVIKKRMEEGYFFACLTEREFVDLAMKKYKKLPTEDSVSSLVEHLEKLGYGIETRIELHLNYYVGDKFYYIVWKPYGIKKWLEMEEKIEKSSLEIENQKMQINHLEDKVREFDNLKLENKLLNTENRSLKKQLEEPVKKWFK